MQVGHGKLGVRVLRQGEDPLGRYHDLLSEAALSPVVAEAVAPDHVTEVDAGHAYPDLDDFADEVTPDHERECDGCGVSPRPYVGIYRVDGDHTDTNPHLPRARVDSR